MERKPFRGPMYLLFSVIIGAIITFILSKTIFDPANLPVGLWIGVVIIFTSVIYILIYMVWSINDRIIEKKQMKMDTTEKLYKEQIETDIRCGQEKSKDILVSKVGDAAIKYMYNGITIKLSSKLEYPYQYIGHALSAKLADDGRIKLYCKNVRIGSVDHPTVCSVTRQWLSEELPIRMCMMNVFDKTWTGVLNVAFYKDQLGPLLKSYPEAKLYKLTGSRTEERQINAYKAVIGEECELDINDKTGSVVVYDHGGNEYGCLPPAAVKTFGLEDIISRHCFIGDIQYTAVVEIYVYLF